jgi:hypothetical protein
MIVRGNLTAQLHKNDILPPHIYTLNVIKAILNIGNVEEFCDSLCRFIFTVNRDENIAHN